MIREKKNRRHSKVSQLPAELREALNKKLSEGHTYVEISSWITKMGYPISKTAIGEHNKDYALAAEKLRLIREQARVIADNSADRPATELIEVASSIAQQKILEHLISADIDLESMKTSELIKAVAMLDRSTVNREKLRLDARRKADALAERIKAGEFAEGKNIGELLKEMYGIIS